MKKTILFPLILLIASVAFTSCRKEKNDEITYVELNATIASGSVYTLDLSTYGGPSSHITISRQAAKHITSEINKDALGRDIYSYSSNLVKSNGSDNVEITVADAQRNGCGDQGGGSRSRHRGDDKKTIITINFTIQ